MFEKTPKIILEKSPTSSVEKDALKEEQRRVLQQLKNFQRTVPDVVNSYKYKLRTEQHDIVNNSSKDITLREYPTIVSFWSRLKLAFSGK